MISIENSENSLKCLLIVRLKCLCARIMQRSDWVQNCILRNVDDVAHAKLPLCWALDAHFSLSEFLATRSEQRLKITIRVGIAQIDFISAEDHRHFFVKLNDSREPESAQSLYHVKVVDIIDKDDDAGSLNLVISLLDEIFGGRWVNEHSLDVGFEQIYVTVKSCRLEHLFDVLWEQVSHDVVNHWRLANTFITEE